MSKDLGQITPRIFATMICENFSKMKVLDMRLPAHIPLSKTELLRGKFETLWIRAGLSWNNHLLQKNLWGYSVMTAIHLIYRLPTKSLNLKSPTESLEKLFPSVRLRNGLEPKVFGCVGHVHVCNLSLDKLLNKALKYVFVGY